MKEKNAMPDVVENIHVGEPSGLAIGLWIAVVNTLVRSIFVTI